MVVRKSSKQDGKPGTAITAVPRDGKIGFTIRITTTLNDKLRRKARKRGVPKSYIVLDALERCVEGD